MNRDSPLHTNPPALHQREEAQEANRRTAQNHGGNNVEEDNMAEALWLSQMGATRGRTGQRNAEFL